MSHVCFCDNYRLKNQETCSVRKWCLCMITKYDLLVYYTVSWYRRFVPTLPLPSIKQSQWAEHELGVKMLETLDMIHMFNECCHTFTYVIYQGLSEKAKGFWTRCEGGCKKESLAEMCAPSCMHSVSWRRPLSLFLPSVNNCQRQKDISVYLLVFLGETKREEKHSTGCNVCLYADCTSINLQTTGNSTKHSR